MICRALGGPTLIMYSRFGPELLSPPLCKCPTSVVVESRSGLSVAQQICNRAVGDVRVHLQQWRMRWDSNPRKPCDLNGFRDRPIRPLSHSSVHEVSGSDAASSVPVIESSIFEVWKRKLEVPRRTLARAPRQSP